MTAPPAYAAHMLAKQLPLFLKAYPDIQLDLVLAGEQLNLFENKMDVAIRQTHAPSEDRIAKLLSHVQLQICASNIYLKKYPERWPFVIDNEYTHVYVKPRLVST